MIHQTPIPMFVAFILKPSLPLNVDNFTPHEDLNLPFDDAL